jgi:uncharacterized protein YeaC (DUF1315 family)
MTKGPVPRPLAERFWAKVNKDGPLPNASAIAVHPEIAGIQCWIFGPDVVVKKAPKISVSGVSSATNREAHRVAWFLETGKWPTPQCLHRCDRPNCVRFSHLWEGTIRDNMQDMIAKGRDRLVGERHSEAKLTDDDVREIRRLGTPWVRLGRFRHPGKRGTTLLVKRLARRFGVSVLHIEKILRNESRKGTQ